MSISENLTIFQMYIVECFAKEVYPDGENAISYEAEANYLCMLNAPEQYEIEDQMLTYVEQHPKATLKELVNYFRYIVPPGLPPCAVDWDDDDDE